MRWYYGVISVSYPVDKLVIWISETKGNLKRFKDDSAIRLYLLKQGAQYLYGRRTTESG